ncbi:MAG: hypothetical protein JW715_07855 [Sedimentisphaerales bacterium]|nr:hypothetical protein [Sedimentisphaerales bacterium]
MREKITMRKNNNSYLIAITLYAGFVSVTCAGTKSETSAEKQPNTWDLIRKAQVKTTESAEPAISERVLHFPKERSFGQIMIQDFNVVRNIQTFFYWSNAGDTKWEYLGEAQGDVKIPSDKKVRLILESWTWQNPQILSALRLLQPDDIYSLILSPRWSSGIKSPSDECMPYVAHLRGLRILNLSEDGITSRGLKFLTTLNSLEQLYAPGGLTNDGLSEIASLSSLKALYIGSHNLTNADLANLAKLPLLEELDLAGRGRVNDAGLIHLAKLPRLSYLMLGGENFTDNGIAHLKNCPSLRILNLGYLNQLTDEAVIHLSEIPQLERICFHSSPNITNAGIIHLTKLKFLTMLDIKNAKVTDKGLIHLAKIKTLENLTLPDIGITDAGVEHITQLQNLRYLWVATHSSSPLTDKSLQYISTLKNLEELHTRGSGFSSEGTKHIAKLDKLRQLSISGSKRLTDDALAELSALKSLTYLGIGSGPSISISGLKSLNNLKNLKKLSLNDIYQDNSSAMDISGLTSLEDLTFKLHKQRKGRLLISDSFKDEDWACLANLTELKTLQITGVGISNEGIKHLSSLRNLEFLNIICPGEKRINDEALKYVTNMHKLNRLYIKDGHFTDRALDYLNGLPSLSRIELTSDYAFSVRAIQDFQRKNPNVKTLRLVP